MIVYNMQSTPRTLLSIDIGIINLSYCLLQIVPATTRNITILSWGIINLSDNKPCCHSGCKNTGTTCIPTMTADEIAKHSTSRRITELKLHKKTTAELAAMVGGASGTKPELINMISANILKECREKPASSPEGQVFCAKHAKLYAKPLPKEYRGKLEKKKMPEIIATAEALGISVADTTGKKIKKQDLITAIQAKLAAQYATPAAKEDTMRINIVKLAGKITEKFNETFAGCHIDTVIIENQIVHTGAGAGAGVGVGAKAKPIKMKLIQCMVTQYFSTSFQYGVGKIEGVSAANKLKFGCAPSGGAQGSATVEESESAAYKKRKNAAIERVAEWLKHPNNAIANAHWVREFATYEKADDMADSLLQGLQYVSTSAVAAAADNDVAVA